MKLSDLLAASDAEEESGGGGNWETPDEGEYRVEVMRTTSTFKAVRPGTTKKGFPMYGIPVTIISDGDTKGDAFWINVYFSAHAGANKSAFALLEGMGIDRALFERDAEPAEIAAALEGQRFDVKIAWPKGRDDFPRFVATPVEGDGWTPDL